jgi:hypothetical protein
MTGGCLGVNVDMVFAGPAQQDSTSGWRNLADALA